MSKQVAAAAAAFLSGESDPLATIRRILGILGDVDRFDDPDVRTIAEIDRATAHLPDPAQRGLWDPAALATKDREIEAYFHRAGPKLRDACEHIVAKWG